MQIRFERRVALVTGAAQGIGRAIAAALVEAGARVHLADLDADGVAASVADSGEPITSVPIAVAPRIGRPLLLNASIVIV